MVSKKKNIQTDKKELKKVDTIILKDFHAKWCQPCKIQHQIIEELKEKYREKVIFESIDIDKNEKIAKKLDIYAVPTLIIEKNGIVVNRFLGVTSKKILENELNNLLKNIY